MHSHTWPRHKNNTKEQFQNISKLQPRPTVLDQMSSSTAQQLSPSSGSKNTPESPLTDHGDQDNWSGDESELDGGNVNGSRKRARKDSALRPLSVSCETCKLRKVKCDRGQPSCGWCLKNGQPCEYKERKKPGLRAGYGRELESKLAEQATVLSRCSGSHC